MNAGLELLSIAGNVFMPVFIEACAFLVCFNVGVMILKSTRFLTNLL